MRKLLGSRLAQESFQYMFWQLTAASIPFFMLPIFTRIISPADYGVYGLFMAVLLIINPLINPGYISCLARNYKGQSARDSAQQIHIMLTLALFVTGVLAGVIIACGGWLEHVTHMPRTWQFAWLLLGYAGFLVNLRFVVAELMHQPHHYAFYRLGLALLLYTIAFMCVYAFTMSWKGLVLGQVLATTIMAVFAFIFFRKAFLRRYGPIRYDTSDVWQILRFSLPLVFYNIGLALIQLTDRLVLNYFYDTGVVGGYTAGVQLANVIFIFVTAVLQAFTPWVYEKLHSQTGKDKLIKAAIAISLLFVVVGGAYAVISPLLIKVIFNSDFEPLTRPTSLIALGFSLYGVYMVVLLPLLYAKKTIVAGIITLFVAVLNAGMNMAFVPLYAGFGSALSTVLSYSIAIALVLTIFLTRRQNRSL